MSPVRFTFILVLAALGTGLAAVGGWRYARASAPVSGPIIVISIDTLRADHLPAYGYTKVKTPAIDALAADGAVFERAYSHAPQTLPAHASMLSGQLPFETGVRDNVGFAVKTGERLLPQMLRERGFTTGGVVSAFVLRKETGISQGFDFFDGEMPPAAPELSIGQVQRDGGASEKIAEHWLDTIGTSRAFLFLHLYEPHKPYAPPERFAEYAPYDGEIAYADEIVGRLVKYLKSHQLYDRSTIMLLSDHGEGLGDHGEQEHGLFVYDEAIHVPLIVKQEGNTGAGRRIADLVQHIDLVPTILDLVKAPRVGSLRGRSLKPVLEGTGTLPPPTVYSEALYARYHFGWSELTSLTDERYRYIKAPREELYDCRAIRESAPTSPASGRSRARRCAARSIASPPARRCSRRPRSRPMRASGSRRSATSARRPTSRRARATRWPIRKTSARCSSATAPRSTSPASAGGRRRSRYCSGSCATSRRWPTSGASSRVFATRIDRYDLSRRRLQAIHHAEAAGAGGLHRRRRRAAQAERLDEAREQAQLAVGRGGRRGPTFARHPRTRCSRGSRLPGTTPTRRVRKPLAHEADPALPLPAYVDARLLYDQGKYEAALPLFFEAVADLKKPGAADCGAALLRRRHARAAGTLYRGRNGVPRGAQVTSRRTSARAAGWRWCIRRANSPTRRPACSATCSSSRPRRTAMRSPRSSTRCSATGSRPRHARRGTARRK